MEKKKKKLMKFGSRKFYSMLCSSSIGTIIISIMMISDSLIAGYFYGENGISAVNIVLPLFTIAAAVTILIDVGTANEYSIEMGKFNKKRADKLFGQGIIISIIAGIILFAGTVLGKDLFLSVIDFPNDLSVLVREYYIPYPFIMLLYPISGYLIDMTYADGDELVCNINYLVQIFANLISSIVLCICFGMQGIAYGTLIGTLIPMIITLFHFFSKKSSFHFAWHLSMKDILKISKFGMTDGEQFLCLGIFVYIINFFILSFFGEKFLPIVTIIVNIMEFAFIFDGIGQAFTPLVSVYMGEDNADGIRDVMKSANIMGIIEGLIMSALLIVFAEHVPKIFGIEVEEMKIYYISAIRIISSTLAFTSFKYIYSSYYILKDQIKIAMFMTFLNDLLLPLIMGISFSMIFGINGLWAGIALAPIASLAVTFVILTKRYGLDKMPLLIDEKNDDDFETFDIVASNTSIVELRGMVETFYVNHNVDKKTVIKMALMIEECCLLICEKNKNKKVYIQCSCFAGEQNRIILRDTGKIFCLTDSDLKINSLNSFVVGMLMIGQKNKKNLTTTGYNRNEFVF